MTDLPGDPMLDMMAAASANLYLLEQIKILEDRLVKQATDLVTALSDLSSELRRQGDDIDESTADYCAGFRDGRHGAAAQLDALSAGPVMQAALDAMDSRTADSGDNS